MALRTLTRTLTAAGAPGAATAAATIKPEHNGYLEAVSVAYDGAPATTDVVVTEDGHTLASATSSNTDVLMAPRLQPVDPAGAPIAAVEYARQPVGGPGPGIRVAVAQADPGSEVTVTLHVDTE